MGTVSRNVDTTHPLAAFYQRAMGELGLVLEALRRDHAALEYLATAGLREVLDRLDSLEWALMEYAEEGTLRPVRPRWRPCDDRRFTYLRATLGGDGRTPGGRTARLLRRLDGPKGTDPPRLAAYHAALQRLQSDGTASTVGPLLREAREALEAFLADGVAATTEGRPAPASWQRASDAIGRLFVELPPAPPSAEPEAAAAPAKAKPGPKTDADTEAERFRILRAWRDYETAWPALKAKRGLTGKPRKDEHFYSWCMDNGREIPQVRPWESPDNPGESLKAGDEWHKRIAKAIHTLNQQLKREGKTLDQYGEELRKRGVL